MASAPAADVEPDTGHTFLPAGTSSAIATAASGGRRLDNAHYFESRFGASFSHVRVHDDDASASLAEAAGARAFTTGSHIFFNRGEYQPGVSSGRSLLAHELAHIEQGHSAAPRLWRQPKAEVEMGEPEINKPDPVSEEEEWARLQVFVKGMDEGALVLAEGLKGRETPGHNYVYIGLHPDFVKVYDQNGKSLGPRVKLKTVKGRVFYPGVYIPGKDGGWRAIMVNRSHTELKHSGAPVQIGQEPLTAEEKKAVEEEVDKAILEGRQPKVTQRVVNIHEMVTEPERFRTMAESVPNGLPMYFAPKYDVSGSGDGKGGTSQSLYRSPIEGRGDGQPANAPPWPVTADGPKLVPADSSPTYSAKVEWSANGNWSIPSQVISQVGETIHYKWELFDITKYANEQIAKDPASTKSDAAKQADKTLDQRIEEFKHSKAGTGKDVTGISGAANREFSREFEDWWKDTKRAKAGAASPEGDTVREKLSNSAANRLTLELAPVSLLVTAVGAVLRWLTELFAGPRQQQEINLEKEGIYLIRVITTPGVNEDTEGKKIIRPPSVAAKVTEVTSMQRAVDESLDEPGAQLQELKTQIEFAEQEGNTAKAEYLKTLLAEAELRFQGSPLDVLKKKHAEKLKDLHEFQKNYPTLSDYSRAREVSMLDDQIKLYERHERERTTGGTGLGSMRRVNATLISEVTGEQYPLLLSAGPMAKDGDRHRWMISDVTSREGEAFIGLGDSPSAAFTSALNKLGKEASYGRGQIGVATEGLSLEAGVAPKIYVASAPADWALAQKRIDDLVMTLAMLGLIVGTAGTAGAIIGAGVAAARLIQRWQKGTLYLDAAAVNDVLGLLGGIGAGLQIAQGLRVQKLGKMFTVTQEGRATEAQIAKAAKALDGAQELFKAVEIANEALNYGGLIWGNVEFLDEMMSINEQERTGAITHAAARRARASALSSAIQNNGMFLAGNVMKAKEQAKAGDKPADKPATEPAEKPPAPQEKPADEASIAEEGNKPAQKAGEPVPIGERRATLQEMQNVLPKDIQGMVVIDTKLTGDTVRTDYQLDPDTGLITDITLRCSPDARPDTVRLHEATVRTMQKYQGFSGRVRQAIRWVADLIDVKTLSPDKTPRAWEASLEIKKLPKLMADKMAKMRAMKPDARAEAEAELAKMEVDLDRHQRALDLGGGDAAGFVAVEGLSKAKKQEYAKLLEKLRGLEPGTDPHKDTRWEMYELVGGDLPRPTWEKVYDSNVKKAKQASVAVVAEQQRLGWGETEQTVKVGKDEVRRLDIADVKAKKGVEVKAYESGYITASQDIVWEVERDAKLVKPGGWQITWVLVDTTPSAPLLEQLRNAGITVELRTKKGGGASTLVNQFLPYTPMEKQKLSQQKASVQ